jgi:N-acetylmuramoyl-L-alanine amidase
VNIDESRTAKGYTPAAQVPAVFGAPRTLDGILIHHWGEPGQTHDGVVDFFVNGPGTTSAHFVVSGGRWTCLVSPLDAAWHCPGKNASHIGIECRPEASPQDYAALAALVAWLRSTYKRPLPLSRHRDWYPTACPGVWDLNKIDALAKGVSVQPASSTPVKTPSKPAAPAKPAAYVKDPHWVVDPGDTLAKIAAHYGVTVADIATFNGIRSVNRIKVGETIWPPVGLGTWTVDPGDNATKIVAWVKAHWDAKFTLDDLKFANGLSDPNKIKVGDRLKIARRK